MGLPPQYHNGLYSNTLLLDYTTNEIHGVKDYMMYTIALMQQHMLQNWQCVVMSGEACTINVPFSLQIMDRNEGILWMDFASQIIPYSNLVLGID